MSSEQPDQKIDFHQLKHLLKAAIKLDTRSSSQQFGGRGSRKFPPILQLALFQVMVSIGLALGLYFMPARLVSTILVVTVAMTFTAINIMIEFGSLIMSPDDHDIISPLPVNSRTFFYSKLINLLFYTTILTAALGIAPTIAILIKTGNPMYALVFPALLLAANTATSLAVSSVYASLLKHVRRERITSILSYVQMIMGGIVYAGYAIVPRVVSKSLIRFEDVTDWWIFLLPPTWFASFIGLAGEIDSSHWIWSSLVGIAALGVLYMYCMKYLSIDYSASLARSLTTSGKKKPKPAKHRQSGVGVLYRFLNPEETAIFRLVWAQFKHDSRFKMTILAIVPMTVLYLFLAFADDGGFADPFISGIKGAGHHSFLVFFAIGIFPSMIQGGVLHSASYQASWIFFATPANLTNVMLSTRRFIQLFFILPYLLALFAVFVWFFGNLLHSFMLLIVLYFLTMMQLSVTYSLFAGVPFSRPVKKGQNAATVFLSIIMPVGTIILPMVLLEAFVFTSPAAYSVTLVLLLVTERLFSRFTRGRVAIKAASARYLD
jgi:hypothetical protein